MDDVIIGRKEEKELLRRALRSPRSELIAVFGRRRIGKTFLIRNLYKDHISLEFAGMYRGILKDQLKNFHDTLGNKRSKRPVPRDWMEAFAQLEEHLD